MPLWIPHQEEGALPGDSFQTPAPHAPHALFDQRDGQIVCVALRAFSNTYIGAMYTNSGQYTSENNRASTIKSKCEYHNRPWEYSNDSTTSRDITCSTDTRGHLKEQSGNMFVMPDPTPRTVFGPVGSAIAARPAGWAGRANATSRTGPIGRTTSIVLFGKP